MAMDYHTQTDSDAIESEWEWPHLATTSAHNKKSIPQWTTISGPAQVLVMRQFLSPQDCSDLRRLIDQRLEQDPSAIAFLPGAKKPAPRPGYAYRDNDRVAMQAPEFADRLWKKTGFRERWFDLWQSVPNGLENRSGTESCLIKTGRRIRHAVGLSSNVRLYRYQQGQSFGAHYDEAVEDFENETRSEYTVLVYLNGGEKEERSLQGGETVFYPKGKAPTDSGSKNQKRSAGGKDGTVPTKVAVAPEQGMLLVHKHGNECMLHEALMVMRGSKYVLRTDVVYEM